MTQPDKFDRRSHDVAEDTIAERLRRVPEIRTADDRLGLDRPRLAPGEAVDVGKECCGMSRPGKADCFQAIPIPSLGILRRSALNSDGEGEQLHGR